MNGKHYYTLNEYYQSMFGSKVFKVSLDADFTCPNKDGTLSTGGCIFCTSTPYIGDVKKSLKEQFNDVRTMLHKKWKDGKYIIYLEANTNTYASVDRLKSIYEPLIQYDNVVGLSIGTRCDCLGDDIIEYLSDLNKRTFLTIELGLQSMHNKTLEFLNRGHTQEQFTKAVLKLKKHHIRYVVHIINGLPNETEEMMVETVKFINSLGVDGIKIHMLYIEKGSKLASIYKTKPFHILTKDEYISIVCKQLQFLDKNIVIERITGDPDKNKLITPEWLIKKFVVLNDIDKFLKANNIYQGDLVKQGK